MYGIHGHGHVSKLSKTGVSPMEIISMAYGSYLKISEYAITMVVGNFEIVVQELSSLVMNTEIDYC